MFKKAFSLLICFTFFSLITSCNTTIKLLNGEKSPKIETEETLTNFIRENALPFQASDVLVLRDSSSLQNLSTFNKYPKSNYIPNPNVILFNKNGFMIDDDVMGGCVIYRPNSKEMTFYDEIFNVAPIHPANKTIRDLEDNFLSMSGEPVVIQQNNDKPIVIIIWSKYKGTKWAQKVSQMVNLVKSAKTSMDVYYLNVDPSVNWNFLN